MEITKESIIKGFRTPVQTTDFLIRRAKISLFNHAKSTYIYSKDWDLLIVLDACRFDLMKRYDNQNQTNFYLDYIYSPASITGHWMSRNFSNKYSEEKSKTTYVVAAPWSDTKLSSNNFDRLAEVWRDSFDEQVGSIHPEAVVDKAVYISRNIGFDRMIVHFMQPHFPSFAATNLGSELNMNGSGWPESIWKKLESGEVNASTVWNAYYENLKFVLSYVDILTNNIDAGKSIITSDHGNSFGEAGLFGHPANYWTEELRKVPWCELKSEDKRTHEPDFVNSNQVNVTDQLRALGYH